MSARNLNYSAYLAPKHWPMWLALFFGKCIAHLPLRIQLAMGRLLGGLAYYTLKSRRSVAQTNIEHCFPELEPSEQQKLVKAAFYSNGMGLIETLRSWFVDPASLRNRCTMHGFANLENALAKGKGVILLGGHYSTLDLTGSLTTLYFKADILQRDHSNPLFNAMMTRARQQRYETVLAKKDLRGMVRCLRKNHIVWYATDQDYGRSNTVFAPFFGLPCATLVSTMRIARMSGAAVVPFSHFRRTDGSGYDIYLHPALAHFPSGDDYQDATRLNMILEQEIRRYPEQYLWMHRRFKTTTEKGVPNIYGQIRLKN